MTRRLLFSYLAVTVVVLVLLEVPLGIFYARREMEQLTAAVDRDASVIATVYEDALETSTAPDPGPAKRYARRTGARVVVVDTRGISLVDTERDPPRDFSTRPEISAALDGRRAAGTRTSQTLDTDLLYVALPVASGGRVHGALRVTLDTREVDKQVGDFWLRLGAIALVVIGVVCIVGWLAARSISEPIRRLSDTARRFARGELDAQPPTDHGPPEVQELATTMASMAAELSQLIDEQRAFVADASHQLRTPLTALRLRLENLQLGLDDARSNEVDSAIDEIDRLSVLVADLLRLARADRRVEVERCDLAAAAAERVDIWSAVADEAGVTLTLDGADDGAGVEAPCAAVPGAVEQILDNVLDNAIGHTPAGGTVRVAVTTSGATVELTVDDEGPGLSDNDKARAVRRFWRGDATRSGSGLGLAIVSELVTSSGGTLQLADSPSGGLSVHVRLRRPA